MTGRSRAGRLRFFEHAGMLKSEPRRGWVVKLGMEHPESVADHSYRVALMAMVYSDLRGLDTEKVLRMALLHDLAEATVGDSIPGERAPVEKRLVETTAMTDILGDLDPDISKEYMGIWEEYEEKRTPEAMLVSQVDKVEMALQASEYRRDGAGDMDEFYRSARRGVVDPELLGLIGVRLGRAGRPNRF